MARWGNGATTDVVVCGKEPICSNPKHRQLGCVQLKNAAKTLLNALQSLRLVRGCSILPQTTRYPEVGSDSALLSDSESLQHRCVIGTLA